EYFEAKLPLFTPERSRRSVVSVDSASGAVVAERATVPVVTIGTPAIAADPAAASRAEWVVTIDDERPSGTAFTLAGPGGLTLSPGVPVIGPHMAANAGLAIIMLLEGGYTWQRIADALERDGHIVAHLPGRTEFISGGSGPAVYVDFGHSPDAFEKTLAAVR